MELNELLKKCLNKKISVFLINNNKLFPYDNGKLSLVDFGVEGFYHIKSEKADTTIYMIGLRDVRGEWMKCDFSVEYDSKDEIRGINFDNHQIYFEQ